MGKIPEYINTNRVYNTFEFDISSMETQEKI